MRCRFLTSQHLDLLPDNDERRLRHWSGVNVDTERRQVHRQPLPLYVLGR